MARPFKSRCIEHVPEVTVFKPAGVPARELEQTQVDLDELEAIRLVDGEGLDHEEAGKRMGVSRATVGRILEKVRKKIAEALLNGKALVIEQGKAPVHHRPARMGSRRGRQGARGRGRCGRSGAGAGE